MQKESTFSKKLQNPNNFIQSEESSIMSVNEKISLVKRFVYSNLTNKNLFLFPMYRDEVIQDTTIKIIKDFEIFGKTKPIGIYCNKALQFALTKQSFYQAKKRKDFFTAASLDADIVNSSTGDSCTLGDLIPANDDSMQQSELLTNIMITFGEEIYTLTKKVLECESLTKEELKKLRKTEGLRDLLKEA